MIEKHGVSCADTRARGDLAPRASRPRPSRPCRNTTTNWPVG